MSNYPPLSRRAHAVAAELPRPVAFWLLAVTLSLLLFASSAPSPLYVVYQDEWGFSAVTLTSVFGVYALTLLAALLVTGSVSDHVGRRPTILVGLALELVAMVLFAEASSVAWVFAARALQGVATGIAMSAITAALLDLQPHHRSRLGALTGVAAPMAGLALGALATGLLVDHGPDPMRLVFWLLLGVFVVVALLGSLIPETVARREGWRRALRPSIAVPVHLRAEFVAALPGLAATWALGSLILSLGPSITASVLGDSSHLAGGLPIFLMAGISAVMAVAVRNVAPRTTARGGLTALLCGVAIVLVALHERSSLVFFAGTAVAGLGFGPAFGGAFRSLSDSAPPEARGALVSAILAVCYLAFSLPAIAAGIAVTQFGLLDTAYVYGALLIVTAATAIWLTRRLPGPGHRPSTPGA